MTQPPPLLPVCGDPEHRHTGCCQNWKGRSAAEGRTEQDCGPGCPFHRRTMTQPARPDPIARARTLATDYQANPTPARAHNAAQVLWTVLGTLDAVIARTFTITDENDRLAAALGKLTGENAKLWEFIECPDCGPIEKLADQLDMPPLAELPTPPKLCPGFPVAEPHLARLACFLPEGHPGDHDNQPPTGPGYPIVTAPVEWCRADGWHGSSNTLTCFLAKGHEGDHSTNAHPNPRTWPKLATGGIVNTGNAARTGEPSADAEHRCPACGSTSWVSVSLDEGYTRKAQCVPCGKVHANLGPGWRQQ